MPFDDDLVARRVRDDRLHVGDRLRELHDLTAHLERGAGRGCTPGLVREVEGGGAVAALECAVRREVHRRVVHDRVHATVHGPERIARQIGGGPRRLGPAFAVPLERESELREEGHPSVAERLVEVAHEDGTLDRTFASRAGTSDMLVP